MKCDLPRFLPTVHVRSKPHRSLHTDAETQRIWAGIQHVRRDDRRWLLHSLSAHAPAQFISCPFSCARLTLIVIRAD